MLKYDIGETDIEASHDVEAQNKAREFLKVNLLVPQQKRNYLYRHTFIKRSWNVSRSFWRWIEIPFNSDGRVRIGWC